MNRITSLFEQIGRPALIGYLVAGDPDKETSLALMETAIRSGVDLLEIGIPHSDPIADGPVITEAHNRALSSGMTIHAVFELVRNLRCNFQTPVVLMTYYNPVFRRGVQKFYREAKACGVDGMLIVDLPPEEAHEIVTAGKLEDLMQVFLVTPTTGERRLPLVLESTTGYCYVVSVQGITGMHHPDPENAKLLINKVKSRTKLPIAIGFGIHKPAQVRYFIDAGADAVIVGSAIVNLVRENLNNKEQMLAQLGRYIRSLADECRSK